MANRSTILFPIPDAEPLVGELRRVHDPASLAGIGAHITLLFPFMPPAQLDDAVVARVRECFEVVKPLELVFDRVARFPGLCYLALEQPKPVTQIIRGLALAWPAYPPYEGKYPEITPHLTVAHGDDAVHDAVERALAGKLPLVTTIHHATLMVEDEASHWHEHTRFVL